MVFETASGSECTLEGTSTFEGESFANIFFNCSEQFLLSKGEVREFREWLYWVEEQMPQDAAYGDD